MAAGASCWGQDANPLHPSESFAMARGIARWFGEFRFGARSVRRFIVTSGKVRRCGPQFPDTGSPLGKGGRRQNLRMVKCELSTGVKTPGFSGGSRAAVVFVGDSPTSIRTPKQELFNRGLRGWKRMKPQFNAAIHFPASELRGLQPNHRSRSLHPRNPPNPWFNFRVRVERVLKLFVRASRPDLVPSPLLPHFPLQSVPNSSDRVWQGPQPRDARPPWRYTWEFPRAFPPT